MKRFTKLMSLLFFAAATQYSCINDADVDSSGTPSGSDGNVALFIEIPNDNASERSAESSGETDPGSEKEYAVNSLTLYLFDSATKVFVESHDLQNIKKVQSDQKIQYTADRIKVEPGTYNIFAIANGKAKPADFGTQEKFLGAIDDITYSAGKISNVPDKGFVMTNRGAANLNLVVSKPTDSHSVTNVPIGLERVVAKIELSQVMNSFPLLEDGSKEVYATITLNNFKMLNLPTRFYTFRHTAVLNSFQEPAAYTDENFGSINDNNGYIIDPYFFKKTVEGAKDFTNKDGFFAQALVEPDHKNYWAGMPTSGTSSHIYSLENGMYQTAQLNAYSTGIMFKASINIAKDRVINEEGNIINNPSDWTKSLFYYNYKFYTHVSTIRRLVNDKIPSDITNDSSIKELAGWGITKITKNENYDCYYNYWIKHHDNKSPDMGVMEFSIVRNNVYRISVTNIAGLGSGEQHIDPEQPDEYKAELDAKIDVFPWVVRNQDAELE